jgi:hypothetical protein
VETFVNLLQALLAPLIIVGGLTSLYMWWRTGFWAPTYIHVIASIGALVGLLLAWMAFSFDHPMKERHIWLVVIFPAIAYLAFGFYGRQIIERHMLEKEERADENDD